MTVKNRIFHLRFWNIQGSITRAWCDITQISSMIAYQEVFFNPPWIRYQSRKIWPNASFWLFPMLAKTTIVAIWRWSYVYYQIRSCAIGMSNFKSLAVLQVFYFLGWTWSKIVLFRNCLEVTSTICPAHSDECEKSNISSKVLQLTG